MREHLRMAIFGCSAIAGRFAAACQKHPRVKLVNVASRNLDKVNAFADAFGIAGRTDCLMDILSDPDVDAVYIALPHKLHAPWTLAALKHHKAVLCEKPAVIYPDEMKEIAQASQAAQTLFMEAMKTRFVPAYRAVKELVEAGRIGDIQQVQVSLCNDFSDALQDSTRYYNQPDQGGSLFDGGCYELNYLLDYLPLKCGKTPNYQIEILQSQVETGRDLGVLARITVEGTGQKALLESSMIKNAPKTAVLTGSQGRIIIDDLHRPQHFCLENEEGIQDFTIPYDQDDMYSQLDAFCQTWAAGDIENEIMSHQDSLDAASLLVQIRNRTIDHSRNRS